MSADPLAVHGLGGDLNLYAYVSGEVLKNIDPHGLLDAVVRGGEELKKGWSKEFSKTARRYGLSGKVIREVLGDKRISVSLGGSENSYRAGATNGVKRFFGGGKLNLTDATEHAAMKSTPGGPSLINPGLSSVYHELTHAYLDLHQDRLADFVKRGTEHYKGALVTNLDGETEVNDDSQRLFHEALSEYAAARVEGYTQMRDQIVKIKAGGGLSAERLAGLRSEYNRTMSESAYGYTEDWLGDKAWTNRSMTNEMKTFVDQEILGGEISGDFDKDFSDVVGKSTPNNDSKTE